MNRPEGSPPTYEDAMRSNDAFAGASAPILSSPEKQGLMQPMSSPMPPVASVSPNTQIMPPVPAMGHQPPGAMPPHQPPAVVPPGQMPTYVVPPATTVYITNASVGPKPCTMVCPNCHQSIRTTTTVTNSGTAHIVCCLMCLLGCGLCSCIPYCMNGFKTTKHECPSCKAYLGTYKP